MRIDAQGKGVDLETIVLDEVELPESAEKSMRQRAVPMVSLSISCEIVASLCVAGCPYVSGREQ